MSQAIVPNDPIAALQAQLAQLQAKGPLAMQPPGSLISCVSPAGIPAAVLPPWTVTALGTLVGALFGIPNWTIVGELLGGALGAVADLARHASSLTSAASAASAPCVLSASSGVTLHGELSYDPGFDDDFGAELIIAGDIGVPAPVHSMRG